MKKLFTTICAALLTFSLSAQTFGGKAGIVSGTWYGEDVESDDKSIVNPGILIGGSVTWGNFGDSRRTSLELLYSQKEPQ